LRARPLRILTWHIHGSYLYYLARTPHHFYLPVKADRADGYGGRAGGRAWPANLHEVPAEAVRDQPLDCVLFQSRRNYEQDQFEIMSSAQRSLPRVYLEHDPPRQHPTDTRHIVDDLDVLLVHVTHFNKLMWDSGRTPTRVVEHGVIIPEGVRHTGVLPRGIVVINGLHWRGRRLGADLFQRWRTQVPLDLVGIEADRLDGLGEIPLEELPAFEARYRFFCNPIRYTSLGLAVCEAMMAGMPIIALATAEMVTVVENGVSGYVHTDERRLVEYMQALIADPALACRLGQGARRCAEERFNIERFARDWSDVFALVTGRPRGEM
jgi:glycosyltransferase involved in cell wall biosynthesis